MKNTNLVDVHSYRIYKVMIVLSPMIGACAAAFFTVAKVLGMYRDTNTSTLLIFDIISLCYIFISLYYSKIRHYNEKTLTVSALRKMKILLGFLIVLQWNLISYMFPSREFWGFAPLFCILPAFFFDTLYGVFVNSGIGASMIISYIINGEELLGPKDESSFTENFLLRFVSVALIFVCITMLTYLGEKYNRDVIRKTDDIQKKNEDLTKLNEEIISFASNIVEMRDETSGNHIKRVERYTFALASAVKENCPEYGLGETDVKMISVAGVLHDIGKIRIPDSILLKKGRLTPEEFEVIKTHSKIGAEMIDFLPRRMDAVFIGYCKDICLYHHERFDGRGYPHGLVGDEIPISAQIVAISDCFDALTTDRPYKQAIDYSEAARMIIRGECGAFSEKILSCFRICLKKDGIEI